MASHRLLADADMLAHAYEERFLSSEDGLRLFMRDYGSADDPGVPVVCLAGLSRNSADFGPLAGALAAGAAGGRRRRVLAPDYRGRGRSDYDSDWRRYSLPVENKDILAALAFAGVKRAIFIGTSRGGMHAMLLSTVEPSLVAGVALNDIGPVMDSVGLARISGYVGKIKPPATLPEAVTTLKGLMSGHFTLSEAEWQAYAAITFQDEHGNFGLPRYDPALNLAFKDFEANPPPELWNLFDSLCATPLLIVHAANSDLLSNATIAEMARRHPGALVHVVADQGHPALLLDEETIGQIADFVASVDAQDLARAG